MFGIVPKQLWERRKPADDQNRIEMITHCLLLRVDDRVVLVDTGLGEKLDEKGRGIFGIDAADDGLLDSLAADGVNPQEVTDVVLTHLHFDHSGWNTRRDGDAWVPTFSSATYWIAEGELEVARRPGLRASYDLRNIEPLVEAGVVRSFRDESEPVPGLRAVRVPGHTRDMCIILADGGEDGTLAFWSDLCPTAAHVPLTWIMSYDLYPVETMANKQLWLTRAAEEGWLCVFQHDPELPLGRLVTDRPGRFRAEPIDIAR